MGLYDLNRDPRPVAQAYKHLVEMFRDEPLIAGAEVLAVQQKSYGEKRFVPAVCARARQHAGPTQRPILAGAITGLVAEVPAAAILWGSGAVASASEALVLPVWLILILHLAAAIIGGAIYGRVFSRAANDPRGGWLFGISYGFLIWMIGPVTILYQCQESVY